MDSDASDHLLARRVARCLERAPLFGDLDLQTRASVASKLTHIAVPGGSTLFRAGDPGDALYLVLNGRLAVRPPGLPNGQFIAELGADDIVGEMSLIGQRRRSNDVVALRDSEVLRLDRIEFDRLTHDFPAALDGLMHTLVERVSTPSQLTRRRPRTIAIVPRSASPADIASLVDRLVSALAIALQGYGARIRIAGPESISHEPGWFSALEAASDYVIYHGRESQGPWAELCLRQADRTIEVARLADAAVPSCLPPLPAAEQTYGRTRELLLLRENDELPAPGSTAPWLDLSPDTPHHHASLASADDMQRLARLVTGRAIGVVFAGGGARGFAHIGVARALREAHVPIDLLGGTSMGAIVAAGIAANWSEEEMRTRFHRAFVESNPLSDYTVPFVSMFAGRKVSALLRTAFGNLDMEDLPLSLYCVSANLTTGQAQTFRRGLLQRRLRATVAIPGVLPPVFEHGEVLVDGGVIDNFPAAIMRDAARGPVIGIDIETGGALAAGADVTEPWSATEFFKRLLIRRDQTLPFPSIVRILLRSALVASSFRSVSQRNAVDLLVLPPMTGIDLLDWSSFDRAIETGYEATRKALDEVRGTDLGGKLFWPS